MNDKYTDDENQAASSDAPVEPGTSEALYGEMVTGPTPEDERERLNRSVTVIATEIPGLVFTTAATAESGLEVQRIDFRDDLPFPTNPSGHEAVSSFRSFLADCRRRPLDSATATMWANQAASTITVIRNDHPGDRSPFGGRRDDRLSLILQPNPDWVAWQNLSGKWLGQEQMGDALEELLHTVTNPDQADLMEVIESVRVTVGSVFESGIRRQDGQQNLTYKEDTTTSAGRGMALEVPQEIAFQLPLYEGYSDVFYTFKAWFRLRVVGGDLKLQIKLKPHRPVILAAWQDVLDAITEALDWTVYDTDAVLVRR